MSIMSKKEIRDYYGIEFARIAELAKAEGVEALLADLQASTDGREPTLGEAALVKEYTTRLDIPLLAWRSTRTEIHARLQLENPPPHLSEFKKKADRDPEVHHARQKVHFMGLWEQADAAIAAAGITTKGIA